MASPKPRTPAETCLTANGSSMSLGRALRWKMFSPRWPISAGARRSTTIARWLSCLTPAAENLAINTLRLRGFVNLNRRPSLVGRVAYLFQSAVRALRTACQAKFPPVPDHFMRKVGPALAGNNLHQVFFDLPGVLLLRQFQSA